MPPTPAQDKANAHSEWLVQQTSQDRGHPHTRNLDYDINLMHRKFGVHDVIKGLDKEKLVEFLKFRFKFLQEEIDEGFLAIEEGNPDNCVDALIDLMVIAVGTLDLFEVDVSKSWYRVLRANMAKNAGSNPNRPNPFGLPDLIKPEGWVAPTHEGNTGLFDKALLN